MKHNIQISVLGIQNIGSAPEAILKKQLGAIVWRMVFIPLATMNWTKMEPNRQSPFPFGIGNALE